MSRTPYLDLNIPDKSSKGFVVTDVFEPNFTKLDQEAERINLRKMSTEDNTEELKKSTRYKVGDVIEVLGDREKGDGGDHKRIIDQKSEVGGVQLASGLWANILSEYAMNVDVADAFDASWAGGGDGSSPELPAEYVESTSEDIDAVFTNRRDRLKTITK